MTDTLPHPPCFVSVIMPIRNEAAFIARSLGAVLAQDYPSKRMEVIVSDGISSDDTREIVQSLVMQHSNLQLIDNPEKIVPTGLNVALAHARGEIIIRMDAHCEYPLDYVQRLVSLIEETGADNVGGSLVAVGSTNYAQKAICAAYRSPLGVGGALRSYDRQEFLREVDAVHGGCWRKKTLLSAGLFDKEMVRNQDDELSFRLRKHGGRIIQNSTIRVKYHVRDNFFKLFKQFLQYGYWKVRVIQKHPRQASLRHFVPAAFLAMLICLALLAPFHAYPRLGFGTWLISYLGLIMVGAVIETTRSEWRLWPGILLALAAMHIGYGGGFIIGLLRWLLGPLPGDSTFEQVTR